MKRMESFVIQEGTSFEKRVWTVGNVLDHPTQPAVQFKNGDWMWFKDGRRHRLDGPALFIDGEYEYWIHGIRLTKEEWDRERKKILNP